METKNLNKKIPFAAHFHVSPNALAKAYPNDQIAVVHLKTRRIQVLNQTASRVWKLLVAGSSCGEIQESFSQEFKADANEISADIDAILNLLEAEGLISIDE